MLNAKIRYTTTPLTLNPSQRSVEAVQAPGLEWDEENRPGKEFDFRSCLTTVSVFSPSPSIDHSTSLHSTIRSVEARRLRKTL